MKTCANCDTVVIPRADGTCPSCRGSTEVKSAEARPAPVTPSADGAPAKPTRALLPMLGPLLGVVVAAVVTNLSRNGQIDSMTIVTALGALVGGIAGIFGMRALLAAIRRR